MLATLSVFFFHHPGQPNGNQAGEIRKWFWATGVANRYSGRGYHRNIIGDAIFFASLAKGSRSRFRFIDFLDPVADIQSAEYGARSALARTYFCLLASMNPRYLENGEPIPLQHGALSHANASNRHHVFPRAQMQNHFRAKVYNSLCNICFLVASDNQAIGKQLPRYYLSKYQANSRRQFGQVMRSHLIPVGGECGVWQKGIVSAFKQFRKERLALICKELEKKAGIKLFKAS
jgi:hypothetical protein